MFRWERALLAFRTVEEAIEGAERIVRDYAMHSRAAQRVAEECFDSGRSHWPAVGGDRGDAAGREFLAVRKHTRLRRDEN